MSNEISLADSLTDSKYWDGVWVGREIPKPMPFSAPGLNGTISREFHGMFQNMFRACGLQHGDSICELGCGGSIYLPYFRREFGFDTSGVDFSPEGCALSRAIFAQAGLEGHIVQGDVFAEPTQQFDIVFSAGLAEHFRPTRRIVSAMARWVRPGGHLLTLVPNMNGACGFLQRLINPDIYGLHVPLTPDELSDAHRSAGLDVMSSSYFMSVNFSVVNTTGGRIPQSLAVRSLWWPTKLLWSLERIGLKFPPNRLTSPYVAVLAKKPA